MIIQRSLANKLMFAVGASISVTVIGFLGALVLLIVMLTIFTATKALIDRPLRRSTQMIEALIDRRYDVTIHALRCGASRPCGPDLPKAGDGSVADCNITLSRYEITLIASNKIAL
ncbi:MAG: hypothetical protein PGN34_25645 [Methylobacterium frigidaeris]